MDKLCQYFDKNGRIGMLCQQVSNIYFRTEIPRTFLRAKQVGEKRGRFQFVVESAYKAVVLILISL